jgi:hypothetical protein
LHAAWVGPVAPVAPQVLNVYTAAADALGAKALPIKIASPSERPFFMLTILFIRIPIWMFQKDAVCQRLIPTSKTHATRKYSKKIKELAFLIRPIYVEL